MKLHTIMKQSFPVNLTLSIEIKCLKFVDMPGYVLTVTGIVNEDLKKICEIFCKLLGNASHNSKESLEINRKRCTLQETLLSERQH